MSLFMYVCLSALEDLANRWTDMILLHNVPSQRSKEGYNYLVSEMVYQSSQEKSPLENN